MQLVYTSSRGARMPLLIYGTAWKKERTSELVERALTLGFRGVDTACQPKHYDERRVGEGLRACRARGLGREALYIQTKFTPLTGQDPRRIPYDARAPLATQVQQSCQLSLQNLDTNVLDALLLHSPISPFERTLEAWRAMEALVEQGAVRELGISNCYELAVLERLRREARVPPWIVQNRFYADAGYDREIRAFCRQNGMVYQSFWTLTANPHVLGHATLRRFADAHGKTPAQLMFRALTQLGVAPLTGTTSELHMREDLAIFDFELSPQELAAFDALLV